MSEETLVIKERLKQVESRLDANDHFRHELRGEMQAIKIEQAVIRNELKGIGKDIIEGAQTIERVNKKVEDRLGSINRSLWAGFTVFLTAFLTVVGFIISQGGV
jgi:uncharacterized protein (DUF3084 family)